MGEEIDERAGGRFYGIAVGIDSVGLDGSQVPGGKNADLAMSGVTAIRRGASLSIC